MDYLWENPKIIAKIIQNADIDDIKTNLSSFIANNFYENILSSYYIEDNLMYVLTLLLKDEINNLSRTNQYETFLNETACGYLLTELKRKNDIQSFFKTIMFRAVENFELNYSNRLLNFNVMKYQEEYERKNPDNNNKKGRRHSEYESVKNFASKITLDTETIKKNKKIQSEQEIFNAKYMPTLDKTILQEMLSKFKNNKNSKMYDYCYLKLNNCNNNDEIYSNNNFIDNMCKIKDSQTVLTLYQNDFHRVINFIDQIIEEISKNFHLLPYAVKCLCKIISKLITKKFPKIGDTEKCAFIGDFFFGKLFLPILQNPGVEAFINNFIISENSLWNLKIISNIIMQFSKGQFYKSDDKNFGDYTPFNWYFLEKMPKIFDIYDHITSVQLPDFIEKLIDNKLPNDFEYDYFKENPDEVICHRSICFNINELSCLLNNIDKCQDILFKNMSDKLVGLQKTVEKINNSTNKELVENIKNDKKYEKVTKYVENKKKKKDQWELVECDGREILPYFLVTTLLTNKRYSELFAIKQKTPYFSIDELKKLETQKDIEKNNIIKVKNFFCSLLYNYNSLVKTDFSEKAISTTQDILFELNTFMKSQNFISDSNVPPGWYVSSLLEYLKKIPENLTKNDCENLYKEIENDINKSIKELDFEALSVCLGKMKFAQRGIKYYSESKKLLKDIELNEKTKLIIEKEILPMEIIFKYQEEEDEEKNEFDILKYNIKEKKIDYIDTIISNESQGRTIVYTIDNFTKAFPNLVKYQELQDADIFQMINDLKIPIKIENYFDMIIKTLLTNKKVQENEKLFVFDKIYDYVMNKIYDKIYPIEPYEQDNKIFQQSVRLSWTKPINFIPGQKNYVYGGFMNDVNNAFEMIDKERSPRKKLMYVTEIFNSIDCLLRFNGKGKEVGVDDQIPVLNYAFVKSQPLRMYSNVKYMELFIGNKKNKMEGSRLTQLTGLSNMMINLTYKNILGVDEKEFIQKCNEATNMC